MIGVYYYPEQWPENQWARDIRNIRKMGMKHIHMAEFSWIHLEPRENHYDFSWLDTALDLARQNDLKIILCTPTATPPIWMSHTYPDILQISGSLTAPGQEISGRKTFRIFPRCSFQIQRP